MPASELHFKLNLLLEVCMYISTYQLTVLESVKHFQITAALEAIEVRYVLPEPVNSSQR